jgi:hypothetical protein
MVVNAVDHFLHGLPLTTFFMGHARARRAATREEQGGRYQPPKLVTEESDSKERLRVSNWIVQGLYDYAVSETVERRLLTVFQHVVDPTRISTVTDKDMAVRPLNS